MYRHLALCFNYTEKTRSNTRSSQHMLSMNESDYRSQDETIPIRAVRQFLLINKLLPLPNIISQNIPGQFFYIKN